MTQTVQSQIQDTVLVPALAQVTAPAVTPEAAPTAMALPETQPATPKPAAPAQALPAEAPVIMVTEAEVSAQAKPQTQPQAAPVAQAPTPETALPAALLPAGTPLPIEAPVVTAPVIKTAEAKPGKSKTADTETDKTAVKADNATAITPDTASLAVIASVIAPVTSPVAGPVTQPANPPASSAARSAIAAGDQTAKPSPTGKQAPVGPQSPATQASAPQNQADATADADSSADKAQSGATPKFASLLSTAPAMTPVANTATAKTPVMPAAVQPPVTPAPQATQADVAAPAQTPAYGAQAQDGKTEAAPVQSVPVQAPQVQAPQALAAQTQTQAQATPRKSANVSAESAGDIATPPPAAGPSGFSLVSHPQTTDATGYTPAATPQAPATSLMSQTAVDNLNALSVQINRRHAEGATKFTMELHPADLGKVDVALSIGRDGRMTAHMTFDSDITAATFSAHETELRQQLRDTGLQLSDDALSFSTRQKTDAVVQAQAHTVNASARSADDSSSGGGSAGGSPQQQNTFTQADSQQGQNRPNSQHLAQMARTQAAADQVDADLDALNGAIDLAAARLNYRQSSSRLALDLSV